MNSSELTDTSVVFPGGRHMAKVACGERRALNQEERKVCGRSREAMSGSFTLLRAEGKQLTF